jgi:hypothetical protein
MVAGRKNFNQIFSRRLDATAVFGYNLLMDRATHVHPQDTETPIETNVCRSFDQCEVNVCLLICNEKFYLSKNARSTLDSKKDKFKVLREIG